MNWNKLILRFLVALIILAGMEMGLHTVQNLKAAAPQVQPPTLAVHHMVKGSTLHLQLTVTRFNFSVENMGKENKFGEGHVHLYIDGKKVAKIFESHYVYPDLRPGKHEVTLELAHNNHESYGVKQSFEIQVN